MWNLVSCKNHYKELKKTQDDFKIANSLHKIKSLTDTSSPKCLKLNVHRPFGKSLKESFRKKLILQENQSLLRKMLKIDLNFKGTGKNNAEPMTVKSLNKERREKSQKTIKKLNKDLLQRVKSVEPVYSSAEWKDFSRFHNYIRDNISRNSGRLSKAKPVESDKKVEELSDDFIDKLYEISTIKLK